MLKLNMIWAKIIKHRKVGRREVGEKEQRTAKTQEELKRKGSHRADATGLDPCASSTVKIAVLIMHSLFHLD